MTNRLSNKPFLIWLLTTPPHLKCVATLPRKLSLMACFADSNVSQGSVATCARCGGTFNIHLTTNLRRNLPVEKKFKSVKIWQNYGHESVAHYLTHPVYYRMQCHIYARHSTARVHYVSAYSRLGACVQECAVWEIAEIANCRVRLVDCRTRVQRKRDR